MLAPVHARSNAPRETVVGSPILLRSHSAWDLNAVAAMKRSGKTVESEKSASATTTGQERARRKRTPPEGSSARLAAVVTSALLARQRPDLDDADHEDDAHEQDAGRGGIPHVHVRER